jgi:hypothetical protein
MMFPRWGTLLTYGSALVMSMLRRPGIGSFGGGGGEDAIGTEGFRARRRLGVSGSLSRLKSAPVKRSGPLAAGPACQKQLES